MEGLLINIEKTINSTIKKFISRIVEEETHDVDELNKLWKEVSGLTNTSVVSSRAMSNTSIGTAISAGTTGSGKPRSVTTGTCPYKFIKGDKEGTVCGAKTKNNLLYCSAHKKYETEAPKEKKVVPVPKADTKLLLRKHPTLGVFYHVETSLAFKSATDKIVVGKLVKDKVKNLTMEDVNLCKKYNFRYDAEKVEKSKKQVEKPIEEDEDEGTLEDLPEEPLEEEDEDPVEPDDIEEPVKPVKVVKTPTVKPKTKQEPVKPVKSKKTVKQPPPEDDANDDDCNEVEEDQTTRIVSALGLEEDD